ncbi:unnamed protein product [Blepharisma stoltei]|uniref:Uncharacterized protein n=1 Tax=Blepharisma stoltei TaxID=1481888 RepID=A0AAU9KKU7_9CILI|nr:unnamed protein product [Blepharisma stoltei]
MQFNRWNSAPLFPILQESPQKTQEKRPTAEDFFDDEEEKQVDLIEKKPVKKIKISKNKSIRKIQNEANEEHTIYEKGEAFIILKWDPDRVGDYESAKYYIPNLSKVPRFKRCRSIKVIGENQYKEAKEVREELDYYLGISKSQEKHTKKRYFEIKPKGSIKIPKACNLCTKEYIPIEPIEIKQENEEAKIHETIKMFNEKLSENPTDPSLWIEYLKYQRQAFGNKKSTIEKELSIINKALKEVSTETNLNLILKHLEIFEEKLLYDHENIKEIGENELANSELVYMWKEYLRQKPDSRELWSNYFYFILSNFSKFSMTNFREIISQGIKDLMSEPDLTKIDIFIEIMAKVIEVEWMSGYYERSIGIYQALAEFYVFGNRAGSFEEYWDSELPRVGDTKVPIGWNNYENYTQNEIHKMLINDKLSDYENNWLPLRTILDKEQAEKSPEGVVFYDDICDYLIPIEFPVIHKKKIIENFLEFLGIPKISCTNCQKKSNMEREETEIKPIFWLPVLSLNDKQKLSFAKRILERSTQFTQIFTEDLGILLILIENKLNEDNLTKILLKKSNSLAYWMAYTESLRRSQPIKAEKLYRTILKFGEISEHEKLFCVHQYFLYQIFDMKIPLIEACKLIQSEILNVPIESIKELASLSCKIKLKKLISSPAEKNWIPSLTSIALSLIQWFIYGTEGFESSLNEFDSFKSENMCETSICKGLSDEYFFSNNILLLLYAKNIQRLILSAQLYMNPALRSFQSFPKNPLFFSFFLNFYSNPKFLIFNDIKKITHFSPFHMKLIINNPKFQLLGMKILPKFLLNLSRNIKLDPDYIDLWRIYINNSNENIKETIVHQAIRRHPWLKEFYLLLEMDEKWELIAEKEIRMADF